MRSFEIIDSVRIINPSQFMIRYENYGLQFIYLASLRLGARILRIKIERINQLVDV